MCITTVLFCWVWWCCVPRLGIDFVPCVQKGAAPCWNRSKPFWGPFWGQIRETDSDLHRSNKCAALVSLRNMNVLVLRFTPRQSGACQPLALPHQPGAGQQAALTDFFLQKITFLAVECVGAALAAAKSRRSSAFSGRFCTDKRARTSNARPHKSFL